jgi:hypothetical protein
MILVRIGDQLFNADTIALVRPVDDEHCVVFTVGQSALDGGFLIEMSADKVEEELNKVDRNALLDLADQMKSEIDDSHKFTHAEVKYEHPANGMDQCKNCVHYLGVNDCELVKPPIRAEDWCQKFKKRPKS